MTSTGSPDQLSAQDAYRGRNYAALGDQYSFISIYPDSPNLADKCWDVSSNASLTHNGGGDALGIVSMVKWTLSEYQADPNRVFVTGTSSGAMMTNVLVGSYPDVFAAGSAWAGVPFGCFAGDGFAVWNDPCAKGEVVKTGEEWASLVENAYPGYTGYRPKIQVLHGDADNVLYPQNFQEEIKQWTSVFGYGEKPESTTLDTPLPGWTRYRFGPGFEAYSATGVTHDIPNQSNLVMEYFDLACDSSAEGSNCFSRKTEW
ncbi:carbohydrate esterase family 1 protein [Periconia macrospinosa]|uniref:Carboxylic ester hydrolase n=1 Tax=Periconia macrospinosa TaxID=97972 RepID=A0A2V1DMK8_9PLEO|nr:carbohydrate esterase family 1 protein [Periconia macrospinosa]